jgi:tRNA pseudouridine38-40 synthase
MVLEYVGTAYHGFQIQENAPTIQGTLEGALEQVTGSPVRVVGAGRTDAGVHALGQVVSFSTESCIPGDRFAPALNSLLPRDIRVLRSFEAPTGWNARYGAISKVYRYLTVPRGAARPSLAAGAGVLEGRANLEYRDLDVGSMREAGQALLGTHDFAAFCASGSSVRTTVRTVKRLDVREERWDALGVNLVVIEVEADGFLYNMVRIIAASLIEVGAGASDLDTPAKLLESQDRTLGPPTAPPSGLYLARVFYPGPLAGLTCP